MIIEAYPHGAPCWFSLRPAHRDRAVRFYCELFGWVASAAGGQLAFDLGGESVAGLCSADDEAHPAGWLPWLASADVTLDVARAESAGARTVLRSGWPGGRPAALIEDAGQAVLGLCAAEGGALARRQGEPGSVAWIEAKVPDRGTDVAFLEKVFGYSFLPPAGQGQVQVFLLDGRPLGGVMSFDERWTGARDPHWLLYFAVGDLDATVNRATELDGSIWFAPFDTPLGRLAYLRDPDGAAFAVVTLADRPGPPRSG